MQHNGSQEVKQQVNKALYGLLGLMVSGVVAFGVYVVSDLRTDVERCREMVISIHRELATIHASMAQRIEQLEEVRRHIEEMKRKNP